MNDSLQQLRIAVVAGTLGRGGTERQMWYAIRALLAAGAEVRVCSLTQGEYYDGEFRKLGIQPWWVGHFSSPVLRLAQMAGKLHAFRPHVIQSMHSFTNLYSVLAGRTLGAISIGALRCELQLSSKDNGRWTKWLLQTPDALIVNSHKVRNQLIAVNCVLSERVYYMPNSIDFDVYRQSAVGNRQRLGPNAIFIGRLVAGKRLDRFLRALSIARRQEPLLHGTVVGDGPELIPMRALASEVGLEPEHLTFLGVRDDLPNLLAQADMMVFCSDSEGAPNVILEAMAAGLPVVTTPAGDADLIVNHGVTGYVVAFDDVNAMAQRMLALARSPELCRSFGQAGRHVVEREFSADKLAQRFVSIYRDIAGQKQNRRARRLLAGLAGSQSGIAVCHDA
jgi:hypothetical protein